jgi:predicted MPP superfamily phosphohydrolase
MQILLHYLNVNVEVEIVNFSHYIWNHKGLWNEDISLQHQTMQLSDIFMLKFGFMEKRNMITNKVVLNGHIWILTIYSGTPI